MLLVAHHGELVALTTAEVASPELPRPGAWLLRALALVPLPVAAACGWLLSLALAWSLAVRAFLSPLSAAEAVAAAERGAAFAITKSVALVALRLPSFADGAAYGAWFSLCGLLWTLQGAAHDRFDRQQAAPACPGAARARTLALAAGLVAASAGLCAAACSLLAQRAGGGAAGSGRRPHHHPLAGLLLLCADPLSAGGRAAALLVRAGAQQAQDSGWRWRQGGALHVAAVAAEAAEDGLELATLGLLYWSRGLGLSLLDALLLLLASSLADGLRGRAARLRQFLAASRALGVYRDAGEGVAEGREACVVCRDDLDASAKVLPCGHAFHAPCLQRWFEVRTTCPTCRRDLGAG